MGSRPQLNFTLLHACQRAPAVPFDFEEPRRIRKRAVGQRRKRRWNPARHRRPSRSLWELHIGLSFLTGFFEIGCRAIGDPFLLRALALWKYRPRMVVNLPRVT